MSTTIFKVTVTVLGFLYCIPFTFIYCIIIRYIKQHNNNPSPNIGAEPKPIIADVRYTSDNGMYLTKLIKFLKYIMKHPIQFFFSKLSAAISHFSLHESTYSTILLQKCYFNSLRMDLLFEYISLKYCPQ